MRQKQVVTFGEVMLRLSTPDYARIVQATQFDVTYGGGEANVAISLAQLGLPAAHVTRFPDNELGKAATNLLRKYGVDTQHILYGGDRLGIYFLETGASVRPSKVVYDRSDSAFAALEPDMIDWDEVFADAAWFHWTGITPAISAGAAACCQKAIEEANKKGITVSADINYRKNLWQYGKAVEEVMPELMAGCDLIVSGLGDAKDILGITPKEAAEEEAHISVFRQIMDRFPKIKKIVNTTRGSVSASHNTLSGMLWNGEQLLETQTYDITPIVDRIGGGDAFIAGLIYGQLQYQDDQRSLDFGVAASVLKHTIKEDANLATVEEVEAILGGNTSGRLVR
ncbi:2-dehydro-3-deoxygluconokinase [Pontibacter ummariensis]|uniref:2-dehydro-3-deoxygluconokinase n=1 Tax=Pontibacter ummariensis TaxID=1610492 RepID=A0A239H333_9BACT|nr:sugar kinase [Pontibacter ummariensis]PRY10927.1 2-dehydro-3-deoxygluconokinase [Pontibacter ummariensis]SNS75203.1 2-dehydro-3-deoxygluconokinase [Pontibacter ummariensis]